MIHYTGTVSSHTKHTSSILNTMNIPQYISYTFPIFRKMQKKENGLTDSTILNIFFTTV